MLYILLPVLIPTGISLILLRLALASRDSRARIKLLEKDESSRQKLIHILGQLEQQVEDAVADLVDDPGLDSDSSLSVTGTRAGEKHVGGKGKGKGEPKPPPAQPVLSPTQRKMIAALNTLPNLKKERAYIGGVRNSHAVIVCRDVSRFEGHRRGEGVIRHWADQFIL